MKLYMYVQTQLLYCSKEMFIHVEIEWYVYKS